LPAWSVAYVCRACRPRCWTQYLRLLRLLRTPQDVPVVAPLAVREIYYRVLMGDLGPRLRELAVADTHAQRIARAIDLLKRRYTEPVRVKELADAV